MFNRSAKSSFKLYELTRLPCHGPEELVQEPLEIGQEVRVAVDELRRAEISDMMSISVTQLGLRDSGRHP